jgi:2-oxoglutarate ferredoxin oxidoreductase subunit beta
MPSIATGASAANRELYLLGVSGDGDSLSIGLGQFMHALRRNLDMIYIIENNGVYGLTKGQFSASADVGSTAKRGEVNKQPPIDPAQMALALGASFVARSFSGDKEQLVPLIKAGVRHRGFALIDVISPCVTFNDHEDSTKSYAYAREFNHRAVHADFVPPAAEIKVAYDDGEVLPVELHDGSRVLLRKVAKDYDARNRGSAIEYIRARQRGGEIVTGLLYLDEAEPDMHGVNGTVSVPLARLPYEDLCPGRDALVALQKRFR